MAAFEEYARYYDVYYADKDYDAECDFIETGLARFGKRPQSILDLACGTGNHGLRLAARGFELCGVDRSAVMLSQYRRKADAQRLTIEMHEQDLRCLELGRQFDAAICMFDAIDYLPDTADLMTFLGRVRAHLRPGGTFLFDFWHAVPIVRGHDPVRVREFALEGGRLIRISTTTLDIARQVANVEFRVFVFEGDHLIAEFTEVHPLRYFLPQEMAFILKATGWEVRHICPAFNLEGVVDVNAWHLVAIAIPADNSMPAQDQALQARYDELKVSYDELRSRHDELQACYDDLIPRYEDLPRLETLQARYDQLLASYNSLAYFSGIVREVPRSALRAIKRRLRL